MLSRIAYYGLVFPLSKMPLWCIYLLSEVLYAVLLLFPYRKKVVVTNLKRSFPQKTEKELKYIRRRFYRHLSDLIAEGIKNLSISKNELLRRYTVKNPHVMEELFAMKKSVVLVSGHYNNWEWMVSGQNLLFSHQAMGIGMPMSAKFWDKKINERRQRFGMIVVHSKNFKDKIRQFNDQPIAILTLSDQSPYDSRKSYWMQFLNQPTAVLFGAELIAHQHNFAVVFYHTRKRKRGRYEMELKLICTDPSTKKWGEITETCTHALENAIVEEPSHWLWSHKRWKRDIPRDLDALRNEQKQMFYQKTSQNQA